MAAMTQPANRTKSCRLCPRLAAFLDKQRQTHPSWHNAPINGFGAIHAPILVVGLAPGLKGANRTGRPFTGDYAGDLLYGTLKRFDLMQGDYDARPDDGVCLEKIRIVNSVRCVPPQNKPTTQEMTTCRAFLLDDIKAMPRLKTIITLGGIAHKSTLKVLGLKEKDHPFGHGNCYHLKDGLVLISSYHCSRYNTQTKRLTQAMFDNIFALAIKETGAIEEAPRP